MTAISFGEQPTHPKDLLPGVALLARSLAEHETQAYTVISKVAVAARELIPEQAEGSTSAEHAEGLFVALCLEVFRLDPETAARYLLTWRKAAADLYATRGNTEPALEQAEATIHGYLANPASLPPIWTQSTRMPKA